jgi:hypothetical protein
VSYPFELNKIYSFSTTAPALLGTIVKNAKLNGIMDYETARKYDEIDVKYRNVYPLLPVGTPDQVRTSIFYKFKAENGSTIVLADQWINMTSVELIESINIRVTVTDISVVDISRIRDALLALGYQNIHIEQI